MHSLAAISKLGICFECFERNPVADSLSNCEMGNHVPNTQCAYQTRTSRYFEKSQLVVIAIIQARFYEITSTARKSDRFTVHFFFNVTIIDL